MDNMNDQPVGIRVVSQIPLDGKLYFLSESSLSNLGINNNLAYTYYSGMLAYCVEEGTRWEWREVGIGEVGLIPVNFTYPIGVIVHGVDYSAKVYNFFKVELSGILPPLERIDQGNGEGIIIRGRELPPYGAIGYRAVDLSFANGFSGLKGATGNRSFVAGYNSIAAGEDSVSIGIDNEISSLASGGVTIGSANVVTGFAGVTIGSNNIVSNTNGIAIGVGCTSSGLGSFVEGGTNESTARYTHAEGELTKATRLNAHSEGRSTEANGEMSHAGGDHNIANAYGETLIGTCATLQAGSFDANAPVSTDRLFGVGNGFIEPVFSTVNRSDAFTVLRNGLASLPSVTNALISAGSGKVLVTKEYLESLTVGQQWLAGDVKEVDCTDLYITTNFDITGLGIGERVGWAICNGQNGTKDRRGRVGVGTSPTYPNMGDIGGSPHAVVVEHSHTTTLTQLNGENAATIGDARFSNSGSSDLSQSVVATTSIAGVSGTDKNMPPYIITLMIQKI